jgi:beta-glucanase (GH16 family)
MRNYRLFGLAPAAVLLAVLLALLLTAQMTSSLRTVQAASIAGIVDDFGGGVPGSWFAYGDYGNGTAITNTVLVTDTPSNASGNVLSIDYVSAGWGAGTGNNLGGVDWSSYDGFSFWFKGANSGGLFRVLLSDNPNPNVGGDSAERFAYEFTDNSSGWRHVSIPWGAFFRDPGFQPGGAPDDGLTLTEVQAYALALPVGTSATVLVDDVAVFGGLMDAQATFAQRTVTVDEGSAVTLTVSLNVTSSVPVSVDYATVGDSAVAGSDFSAGSGTLTIPAGESGGDIVLSTTDDDEVEGPERFFVVLSNPVSVTLTSQITATVTLRDNDEATQPAGGHGVIVDDYEYTTTLPSGKDANGSDIGYVTWSAPGASSSITLTVPVTQVPGAAAGNQVMQLDLNLGAGQWGGFTHAFENEAVDTWVSKDWSSYVGVSFWLYGNNTGGALYLDIQDNRTPGSTKDDAERWSVDIPDDFSGWQFFQIPFSQFNRKDIGNGAPFDGFGKTEIWGYAFGGFNTIANKTYYVDDFSLTPRTTVVDDYEYTTTLPSGKDANGSDIGFVTWNAPGASSSITLTVPVTQLPGAAANNQVIALDLNLGAGQWGGFTHAFENEAVDTWVSQDWSTYEGVCFWLYGNNTGGALYLDIQDNRTPGSTKDDAERWSADIADDFSGWKFFQIPFSQFNRKDIGNGAPFDGFGKTEVWGYAFGGFNTIENQRYYVDDFTLYGNVGGGEESVQLAFDKAEYTVTEGSSAVMTVSLNMTSTQPVTVTYASLEGQATPNRDYTPVSGTLVFAPGVDALTITIPTLEDEQHELEEKVMVNLYDVDGAVFGFQRRAMLTIQDNDAADPNDQDGFDGSHPFVAEGSVALSITELPEGSANALPGQQGFEQVLTVQYNDAASTPNRIYRTFAEPQDWRNANGLTFWYFGNNSGKTVTVDLWDNQIVSTGALSSTQWTLRWSDEFTGTAGTPPNPNNWKHEIGDGALNGIPGWGNSEFQYYTDDPANASLDGNGNLRIRLSAVNTATTDLVCYYGPCRYTSARLLTQDRADFQYGRIEARIKLPPTDQSGVWPAFWSLGNNIREVGWPQSGEIDIMEYVSRVPNEIFGTIHGPGYSGGASYGNTINIPNLTADFHTYSVEWWPNRIVWYVDGVKYHEARNTDAFLSGKEWVYNHPFFLLLNVAIGGNFGGAVSDQLTLPQDTLVDYVRVYQAPLAAEHFEATFVDNFRGWRQIIVPFRGFARSAEQPAGAPNDGLTLSSVHGYGFTFPGGAGNVAAQATVTTHIDRVVVASLRELHMPFVERRLE